MNNLGIRWVLMDEERNEVSLKANSVRHEFNAFEEVVRAAQQTLVDEFVMVQANDDLIKTRGKKHDE